MTAPTATRKAKIPSRSTKVTTKKQKPECTQCGLCCICTQDQDRFCDVTEKDEKRLGAALTKRYVIHTSLFEACCMRDDGLRFPDGALATRWRTMSRGPFRGWSMCTCVFLEGTVRARVRCRVYDRRPDVCRKAMVPGERACINLRALYARGLLDAEENVE